MQVIHTHMKLNKYMDLNRYVCRELHINRPEHIDALLSKLIEVEKLDSEASKLDFDTFYLEVHQLILKSKIQEYFKRKLYELRTLHLQQVNITSAISKEIPRRINEAQNETSTQKLSCSVLKAKKPRIKKAKLIQSDTNKSFKISSKNTTTKNKIQDIKGNSPKLTMLSQVYKYRSERDRVKDTNQRIKQNEELASARKAFLEGRSENPNKKQTHEPKGFKLIINPIETNRRRH